MTDVPHKQRGWRGSLLLLFGGLLLLGGQVGASGERGIPSSLACPAGQTTWLTGTAMPGQALLARFDSTTVGGGSAGADGRWRIPLAVAAPAGIYPVTVVDREGREEVAAFTCFVGVPLDATPTGIPTHWPTRQSITATPSAAATATRTTTTVETATAGLTMTAAPATATTTPSATKELTSSATPTLPATTQPLTATPTSTTTPGAQAVVALVAAQADDPLDEELWEYVVLENQEADQALAGWRLVHGGTGETYVFPAFTLLADEQLVVWSGAGEDDSATGSLFWPATKARWVAGDVAELYDSTGRLISTLKLQASERDLSTGIR